MQIMTVLMMVVLFAALGSARAVEFAFDFNEDTDAKAISLSSLNVLEVRGFDNPAHKPRIKSGAKVPDAGNAAHFGDVWANSGPGFNDVFFSSVGAAFSSEGNSGTIAAWIHLNDGDDPYTHPIIWSGRARHHFGIKSGKLYYREKRKDVSDGYTSTTPAFTNGDTGWHHVAVTWADGRGLKFYVDGKQLGRTINGKHDGKFAATELSITGFAVGNDVGCGGFCGKWQGSFDGDIDELYINFGQAKDADFINKIMKQGVKMVKKIPIVKFPSFDMNCGPVALKATEAAQIYSITLKNTSRKSAKAVLEFNAPSGWVKRNPPYTKRTDIVNTAGPGSTFRHHKTFTIPAGQSETVEFVIDCPNWNPYNRYPLTCKLTVGKQVSVQTLDIVGNKSKNVFLGQPRHAKDIKESSIGVVYPYEHGALPKCLPMVAEAGIKWNRCGLPWAFHGVGYSEDTKLGKMPLKINKWGTTYLNKLRDNGISLIWETGILKSAEHNYEYGKRIAKLAKPYGVTHFEIGNEPNGHMPGKWGGNWNGVTKDKKIAPWIYKFVEFVNAAAKGIKEANPDAIVIAGAGLNSTAFRAIQVGLSKDVDGVSDHPYPYSVTPELVPWGGEHCFKRDGYKSADDDHTFISQMRRLKEEAIKAGRPDMQIWLTEWGIPTHQYEGQTRFSKERLDKMSFNVIEMGKQRISMYEGHTLNTQAKYLARRLIETLSIPDIVTKNFYFCFNRGPWFDKRHWERGGFSMTRTQDGTPKPSFYAMQRICGLFSDGVKPVKNLKIDVPLDRKQGRTGLTWKRPYASEPVLWEGVVPLRELTTPRKHAFTTPQGELMIVVWMPVRAEDWREPDFCDITLNVTGVEYPIAINILTGKRTDLEWKEDTKKGVTIIKSVTVPDSPIVIKMFPKKEGMKIMEIKKAVKKSGLIGTYVDAKIRKIADLQ